MLSSRDGDHERQLDDNANVKESVFLLSIIPDNNFIKKIITDLCNRTIGNNLGICMQLRFSLHAPNENKFYQAKYKQHFPHVYCDDSSINWHQAFLSACEKEYAKLSPIMRQLFMLAKERDIIAINHTLIAQPTRLVDLLNSVDTNEKSLLEWVSLSNDQDFKDKIFDEVCKQFCLAKSLGNISDLNITEKNMLFSFAVGLQQTKQKLMELKNAGADINYIQNGRTALGGAVSLGDLNSVVKLTECGADVNLTGNGISPLEEANRRKLDVISTYLEQHGALVSFQCRLM